VFISVVDPDPDWIRIQWDPWTRIRIQEGKNDQQKYKKVGKILTFSSAGWWMFDFEG
jgi:hypothetical protein